MATYTPFEYTGATPPQYDAYEGGYPIGGGYSPNLDQWNQQQANLGQGAFQGYAQDQFKGLFDMVNAMNAKPDPLASFSAAPRYNPYGGTRADFTTPAYEGWTRADDGSVGTKATFPSQFNQQGYLDAQFGNINDYLSNLGSFFGNIGTKSGTNERVQQDAMARANYAANLPQVGSPVNSVGIPQAGGLSGFSQAAPGSNYGGWGGRQVSGGWGSHPVAGGLLGFGGE